MQDILKNKIKISQFLFISKIFNEHFYGICSLITLFSVPFLISAYEKIRRKFDGFFR